MKKFRALSLLIAVLFTLTPIVLADGVMYTPDEKDKIEQAVSGLPEMSAESYAVVDAVTGEVLFSENADKRLPIASITKMMTALVVVESVSDLSATVTVDAESCGIEGSSVNLFKGERISVSDRVSCKIRFG